MIESDKKAIATTLENWLKPRLRAESVEIIEFKDRSGAGFSAETFYIDVRYRREGKDQQDSLVVRFQNQDSDFFLEADIEFPYRVMEVMSERGGIPVPDLVGLEMDGKLLGAPFLVMRKMPGRVVQQSPNYNKEGWLRDLPPEKRGQVWFNAIDMMARIHRLDWRDGFEFLADPKRGEPGLSNYLNWVEEWYLWSRGDKPIALMDKAFERLKKDRPRNPPVDVLWGDPGSSNILFGDDLQVNCVLDWEMATLGPAEVDLAWWLFFDQLFSEGMGVERLEGLPDRAQTIEHYQSRLGRSVENMEYYDLLATFRMAIVGVRAVDRQIQLGRIPADTGARSGQPIMAMLARRLGEPEPEVGEDFRVFSAAINL